MNMYMFHLSSANRNGYELKAAKCERLFILLPTIYPLQWYVHTAPTLIMAKQGTRINSYCYFESSI